MDGYSILMSKERRRIQRANRLRIRDTVLKTAAYLLGNFYIRCP